jgi:ABC-type phosphate transport system substrate-binding protein
MRAVLSKIVLGMLGCALCVPGVGGFRSASAESPVPIAVVVAKSSPLTNLSLYQLKHIYLGELLTDPDGKRIIPLNQPIQSDDRTAFDAQVLRMSPDQQASYWIDRRIRGLSGSPRTVDSGDLAQRIVARLDGAVAYVPISAVRPDVKIVRVDGKLPDDPGYRIR